MKKSSLGLVFGLAAMVLTGCGGGVDDAEQYTYNTYISTSPSTWNVHTWETNDEAYVTSFTEMGLYDVIFNENRDGYEFMPEMASDFPIQVANADLTDEELDYYLEAGVGNPSAGMVWDIPLNRAATWEDGTPITAADYVDSMDLQLSPEYANYRADSYYASNFVLINAENYFKQGRQVIEAAYNHINMTTGEIENESGLWYINLGQNTPFFNSVFTGETEGGNFYSVLNNRSSTGSNAVELAAARITAGVAYYLTYFVYTQYDEATDTYSLSPSGQNSDVRDEWEDVVEDLNGNGFDPSSVRSTMFEADATYIDLVDFDDYEVRTFTARNVTWEDHNERYTYDDLIDDLHTFVSDVSRNSSSWNWKLPLFTQIEYENLGLTIEDVGIRAIDDYTIRFYLASSITSLNLRFSLTGNWLVKGDLYRSLTTTLPSGAKATRYASNSADNYMSYGPYRLEYFEQGVYISIVRNENWYGYSDGKHEGMFQMDQLYTRVIQSQPTALNEFMAGRLDDITLTANDMRTYGNSSRRTTTMESYTQKISFNTDRPTLLNRQSGSSNKTILANKDFRTALSLAINRQSFAADTTAGSTAFTGLLNDLYLANNATGQSYRSTEQGRSVYGMIYDTYGGETIDSDEPLPESSYGYNAALAVEYMKRALETELASSETGHLVNGNAIDIEFRVYDATSDTTVLMYNFLNSAWSTLLEEAKEEVPGASNVTLNFHTVTDQDYYTSASSGNYDLIFSIWGGAAINPYGLMQVYCDAEFTNCCEYGFKFHQNDPENTIAIDENGDGIFSAEETQTFHAWYERMTGDELSEAAYGDDPQPGDADYEAWLDVHNRKLNILAGLEAGIVSRFEAVPIVARGSSSLNSFKIELGSETYVSLIGYGGIRYITFNYNNGEWSEFVSSNGGNLSELYRL